MRIEPPAEPGLTIERTGGIVRLRGRHNMVGFSQLEEAEVEGAVADQVAFFTEVGEAFEWKLYAHDTPAHLRSVLAASGFEADEPETLMAFDLASHTISATASPDVEVRTVREAAQLATYLELTAIIFGRSAKSGSADFEQRLFGARADTIASITYVDGMPAGIGRLELPRERSFAGLWGGGTLPQFRKRGVYRTLVADRARTARARGYRYLTVDARETSRPILERLGFVALTTVQGWNFEP
jgi:GNAT superfamily N-acetyltransferase